MIKLNLKQKVISYFFIAFLVLVSLSILVYISSSYANRINNNLAMHYNTEHLIGMAETHADLAYDHFIDYTNDPDEQQQHEYFEHLELAKERIKTLTSDKSPDGINKDKDNINKILKQIENLNSALLIKSVSGSGYDISQTAKIKGGALYRRLTRQLSDAHESTHSLIEHLDDDLVKWNVRSRQVTLSLITFLFVVFSLVVWRIFTSIINRLSSLREATRFLRLGQRVPLLKVGPEDEIGQLINSFNHLSEDLDRSRKKTQKAISAQHKTAQAMLAVNQLVKASGTMPLSELLDLTLRKLTDINKIIFTTIHLTGEEGELKLMANKGLNSDVEVVINSTSNVKLGIAQAVSSGEIAVLTREKINKLDWFRQAKDIQTELRSVDSITLVPLTFSGATVGVLSLGCLSTINNEELLMMESAAFSLGTVVQNRLLYEGKQETLGELTAIKMITDVNLTSLELNNLLDSLMERVVEISSMESGGIFIGSDINNLKLRASFNWYGNLPPDLEKVIAKNVLTTKKPFVLENIKESPFLEDSKTSSDLTSVIAAPLTYKDNILGVILLHSSKILKFTQKDMDLIEILNERIASSIIKTNLQTQLEIWRQKYDVIINHTNNITWLTDGRGRITEINKLALDMLGYTTEDIKSLNLSDLLKPESLNQIFELTSNQVATGNKPDILYVEIKKKSGEYIKLNTLINVLASDGEPLAFQFISENISYLHDLGKTDESQQAVS